MWCSSHQAGLLFHPKFSRCTTSSEHERDGERSIHKWWRDSARGWWWWACVSVWWGEWRWLFPWGLEAACAVGCFLGSFYYCCDLAVFDVTTVELFWGIGAKGGMKTFAKNIFLVLWEQMTPTSLWSYNIYIFSHLFIKAVWTKAGNSLWCIGFNCVCVWCLSLILNLADWFRQVIVWLSNWSSNSTKGFRAEVGPRKELSNYPLCSFSYFVKPETKPSWPFLPYPEQFAIRTPSSPSITKASSTFTGSLAFYPYCCKPGIFPAIPWEV